MPEYQLVAMKEQDIRNLDSLNQYLRLVQEDIPRYFADQNQFVTVNCPACGSKEHCPEFTKVGFCYVSCKRCRTLFVNPRPTIAMLKHFYVDAPSSRYWVEGFFTPVAEARREKVFRPRAQYVAERFSNLSCEAVGDVGAGFGLFLEELRRLWPGSRMVAIEPSSAMAAICRSKGLYVVQSAIEEVEGYEDHFGLLAAFEILEHLYEPRALVEKALRLVRPGGRFLVTTLNGEGFDIQVLWERSKSIFPPHHLNFLNPRSLAGLFESVGFVVEEVSTPGQLDWDIVKSAITREGVQAGRFWALLARDGDEAGKQFQSWLSQNGLSSHMRIVARRP